MSPDLGRRRAATNVPSGVRTGVLLVTRRLRHRGVGGGGLEVDGEGVELVVWQVRAVAAVVVGAGGQ